MQEATVSLQELPTSPDSIIFDHPNAPFNKDSIIREILKQKKKFMLMLHVGGDLSPIPDRVNKTGITESWYIALDCFGVQQYPATILFASIAVEALLNHDKRLCAYRNSLKREKWITLNPQSLKTASEKGIDISPLLDRDGKCFEFITRRNKIAHGDISGYVDFLWKEKPNRELIEKVTVTRKQALNQLNRSYRFITKWAESKPTIILKGIEEIRRGI